VDLPKGLFTKELEVALLDKSADLAVHSLKDLPTTLPPGLVLGGIGRREDVRDVLIYRDAAAGHAAAKRGYPALAKIEDFPAGAVIATSSTRRKAQLLARNPGLKTPDIRGNVATRLRKVAEQAELDATLLALAGMTRLGFKISAAGELSGPDVPNGLRATILDTDTMLPCVGQGAIGLEIRGDDERLAKICARLNDLTTQQCVTAERAFLEGMGGGCQSPVAAYGELNGSKVRLRVRSFLHGPMRQAEAEAAATEAATLGQRLASQVKSEA
jgi:hydroxymethylbilane synthase